VERQLIGRGVLAGALGGLLAFVFARIFAEPIIGFAIDYEGLREKAEEALHAAATGVHSHEETAALVSRTVQGTLGIGTGMVLFGAAMGALFAIAYVICVGRTGRVRPRQLALLVAGAAFTSVFLVPFVKYPASPPAASDDSTIKARAGFYLLMVVASVVFMVLAVIIGKRLGAHHGNWRAVLITGAGYIVVMGALMLILPSTGEMANQHAEIGKYVTETPQSLRDPDGNIVFPAFPADLLYKFRLYSLLAQVILWTTIALVFAPMAEKVLRPGGRRADDAAVAA
jgi:hypothetical protein